MPKTSATISFGLIDVTAKPDTTVTASDKQSFIDVQDLALDGVCPAPSATLEKDYWKLDGSYEPFPDSPQNTSWGIWSNSMSDENGNFSVPPVIELSFQNAHKTAGLTFEFCPYGNNYCNHMLIQWYLDDAVIKEAEFYPAVWRCEYRCTVEKYNKLIENLDKYDEHIKMYDTVVDFLEESITKLLNKKQREVIIIYSNYPNNSIERINEAVKKGYSQATFYRIAEEAFDILDEVLALKNRDVEKILKAEKEN